MDGSITTTIRAMTLGDSDQVARLAGELGYPSTQQQIEARFRRAENDPDSRVFVAADSDGRVWGWVHVFGLRLMESGGQAEVGGLAVRRQEPGRRARGVGADGVPLEQEHVVAALAAQAFGDGAADHAAADHHDPGHGSNGSRRREKGGYRRRAAASRSAALASSGSVYQRTSVTPPCRA